MTTSRGAVRDCAHKRAAHQHGTYLAYKKDGCRCEPCRRAGSREGKATRYRSVTGTHSYVDAGPARAHVLALLGTLAISQVEARSGVHRTAIRALVSGVRGQQPSRRISRATRDALLSVRPDRVGPEMHGHVDRTGTQRRLRALIALGWSAQYLTARLRASSRTVGVLVADEGPSIRASTRANVAALYDELWATPGPSSRARKIAARKGWLVPAWWDDDTIDDPAAGPAGAPGLPRRTTGRPSEHVIEDFLDTMDHHQGDIRLAAMRLGMGWSGLTQALYRAQRDGVELPAFHNGYRSEAAA